MMMRTGGVNTDRAGRWFRAGPYSTHDRLVCRPFLDTTIPPALIVPLGETQLRLLSGGHMSVETWLKELGLERYAATFNANDVTEDLLATLTADDLRDIGVASVGHRRRMLDAIAAAQVNNAPASNQMAPEALAERRQVTVM